MTYDEVIAAIRERYPLSLNRNYISLAMCGEVGELANKVKKAWGGYEAVPLDEIKLELADVANYVHHMMLNLGMSEEELRDLRMKKAIRFLEKLG